jgi:hypothetical protein
MRIRRLMHLFVGFMTTFAGPLSSGAQESSGLYPVYSSERNGDVLKIFYDFPYLRSVRNGQRLMGQTLPAYTLKDAIVNLDFKLNNTSLYNQFATSADFKITKSRIVNETIPYVQGGYSSVTVGNIGWAPIEKLKVSYAVSPVDACNSTSPMPSELRSTIPTKRIDSEHNVLFNWKIESRDIPQSWTVPQPPDFVCAMGYLDYQSNNEMKHIPFAARVQISGSIIRGPVKGEGEYDLVLEAGREGYTQSLPISELICANFPDRFVVHLISNRSAEFDFDVSVQFTDQTNILLARIHLDYFRPPQELIYTGPAKIGIIEKDGGPSPPSRQCSIN